MAEKDKLKKQEEKLRARELELNIMQNKIEKKLKKHMKEVLNGMKNKMEDEIRKQMKEVLNDIKNKMMEEMKKQNDLFNITLNQIKLI